MTPSITRCIAVEPKQDTRYTLTAEGFDGATDTASFELKVKPAPPVFRMLAVSDKEIPRGEVLTVCYGVERATGVRMEPGGAAPAAGDEELHPVLPEAERRIHPDRIGRGGCGAQGTVQNCGEMRGMSPFSVTIVADGVTDAHPFSESPGCSRK